MLLWQAISISFRHFQPSYHHQHVIYKVYKLYPTSLFVWSAEYAIQFTIVRQYRPAPDTRPCRVQTARLNSWAWPWTERPFWGLDLARGQLSQGRGWCRSFWTHLDDWLAEPSCLCPKGLHEGMWNWVQALSQPPIHPPFGRVKLNLNRHKMCQMWCNVETLASFVCS